MSQRSRQQSLWLSVVVLFAINILNFYDRHVPGALVEPMRKEFHLNDSQIGLLGSAFIWIYAIFGVPLGRIADSASRKKLLAWGVVIWTAMTASAGLATTYAMLFLSRVGVGVGEAACAPTATSWLGDLFPPTKRSRVLALFMLGVPVGGALGFFFSGPIAQAYGWRAAMVFAAVPALLLVPALLMLQEPERGASENHRAPQAAGSMWSVLGIPTLWWIIASGALLNFSMYAIGTFLPAFLALTYSALTTYYGLVYSAIQDIVAPNQRGAAMAIYFMAMYMCGASLGPLLTGKLSDVFAHRAATLAGSATVTETFRATGLQQAMLIIPVLCIALAFVLYMGSRTITTDIARREAIAGGASELLICRN